jgi:hypothetical protein
MEHYIREVSKVPDRAEVVQRGVGVIFRGPLRRCNQLLATKIGGLAMVGGKLVSTQITLTNARA